MILAVCGVVNAMCDGQVLMYTLNLNLQGISDGIPMYNTPWWFPFFFLYSWGKICSATCWIKLKYMNMSHHHMVFLDIELRCNTLCALAGESKGDGCLCDRWRAEKHCHSAHELASRTRQEVFIYTYIVCICYTYIYIYYTYINIYRIYIHI